MRDAKDRPSVLFVFSNSAQRDSGLEKILQGINCVCDSRSKSTDENAPQVFFLKVQEIFVCVRVFLLSDPSRSWIFEKTDVVFFALTLNDVDGYLRLFDLFSNKGLSRHLSAFKVMVSLPSEMKGNRFSVPFKARRKLVKEFFDDFLGIEFGDPPSMKARITNILIGPRTQVREKVQPSDRPHIRRCTIL